MTRNSAAFPVHYPLQKIKKKRKNKNFLLTIFCSFSFNLLFFANFFCIFFYIRKYQKDFFVYLSLICLIIARYIYSVPCYN